jgi:hypothetical protein
MAAPYNSANLVLVAGGNSYQGSVESLIQSPDTSSWYGVAQGCLKSDPTLISRFHTFPDAVIPRGKPDEPAAPSRICMDYRTAWPLEVADAAAMVDAEAQHPQFAFRGGAPGTVYQIDVESQLRRLDQPLGRCQAVLATNAPLYRNTVAPPTPMGVSPEVQNAANPIAAIMGPDRGADACRDAADAVASKMSGRWVNNPTRYDTSRFVLPFQPPGIGSGSMRKGGDPSARSWN